VSNGWAPVLFASARTQADDENDRWRTGPEVFGPLDREFSFGLDTAARSDSALCASWLGPDHPDPARRDGLSMDWSLASSEGRPAWWNPPYSIAGRWGEVASWQATHRQLTSVGLVFARTETRWWWRWVLGRSEVTGERIEGRACAAEIRWIPGRLTFLDPATGRPKIGKKGQIQRAPAPSVAVVFRPGTELLAWPANRRFVVGAEAAEDEP
jgi:phage N-6-adenine-methyltransferase